MASKQQADHKLGLNLIKYYKQLLPSKYLLDVLTHAQQYQNSLLNTRRFSEYRTVFEHKWLRKTINRINDIEKLLLNSKYFFLQHNFYCQNVAKRNFV